MRLHSRGGGGGDDLSQQRSLNRMREVAREKGNKLSLFQFPPFPRLARFLRLFPLSFPHPGVALGPFLQCFDCLRCRGLTTPTLKMYPVLVNCPSCFDVPCFAWAKYLTVLLCRTSLRRRPRLGLERGLGKERACLKVDAQFVLFGNWV